MMDVDAISSEIPPALLFDTGFDFSDNGTSAITAIPGLHHQHSRNDSSRPTLSTKLV